MNIGKLKINKLFFSLLTAGLFCFLGFMPLSYAQSQPQFLVSWQARSYAPSWYQGKILPINGTAIEVNFELIDNNKLTDLSKNKIRWYVNDKLMINENNGLGIKTFKFNTPDYAGNDTEVRIVIVDYKGNALDKVITVPIVNPEAVIENPYVDEKISVGSSLFKAIPFFFNVDNLNNLSVEWSTNEQKSENPSLDLYNLNLNIDSATPSGTGIKLSVLIKNILNELEFANKSINLTVK